MAKLTKDGTTNVMAKNSMTVSTTRSGTAIGLQAMTSESENIAIAYPNRVSGIRNTFSSGMPRRRYAKMKKGMDVATAEAMSMVVETSRPPTMFAGVRAVVKSRPGPFLFVSRIAFIAA